MAAATTFEQRKRRPCHAAESESVSMQPTVVSGRASLRILSHASGRAGQRLRRRLTPLSQRGLVEVARRFKLCWDAYDCRDSTNRSPISSKKTAIVRPVLLLGRSSRAVSSSLMCATRIGYSTTIFRDIFAAGLCTQPPRRGFRISGPSRVYCSASLLARARGAHHDGQ